MTTNWLKMVLEPTVETSFSVYKIRDTSDSRQFTIFMIQILLMMQLLSALLPYVV